MTKHRKTLPLHTVQVVNESRRGFMKAGAGLALGIYLSPLLGSAADVLAQAPAAPPPLPNVPPSAFLRIAADGTVTVISKHLEMGQGTFTGLATLIAEELDADWNKVVVEGAPADVSKYGNIAFGGAVQGTGGSTAMAGAWEQMRKAGAAAKAMLVSAAADAWKVQAADITVSNGTIAHKASNRSANFGEFAEAAAKLPVPENPTLKTPDQYVLIGKENVHRRDSAAKVNGSAQFTQDVHLPGMLVAVIARAPRYGAKVGTFDDTAAKAIPGFVAAFAVPGKAETYEDGVAVLAKDTWTALKARKALKITWDESKAWRGSSDGLVADYRKLAGTPGTVATTRGNAAAAIEGAAKTVEAEFSVPYLAHASMEPLNCVVKLVDGGCELWNGEQFHTPDQAAVAAQFGVTPDKVLIHQLYAGGSFGRRANPKSEYILQAVQVAQLASKAGHNVPVKIVWSREDDTAGGYYRPLALHVARAGLDAQGNIVGWTHRIVGQSIAKGSPFEQMMIKDGVDESLIEGISDLPYEATSLHVDLHIAEGPVTTQWWRSVGHTHTGFATEAFIDELAAAAGKDPYTFRRDRLAKHPRERGVLDLVAQKAGWETPLAKGKDGERRGRGIAVHKSFGSYVAQVAEVTVRADGSVKVDRVVCAVDCGIAINPDVIRAQMEGGIGYGLSAALHGAITFKDGVVQQSNFHDYKQLRIHEMPKIDVHIVASEEKPTGVGEPGTAVIAPALVNALAAATGKRVRQLPVDTTALRA